VKKKNFDYIQDARHVCENLQIIVHWIK